MFLDRFQQRQNIRKQRQVNYRTQLKNQIELTNSKIYNRADQPNPNRGQETFSLLKNIELQSEKRKNKQQEYYAQLRNQIELQKNQKKRKKQQEAERERADQQKLKRQNQTLKQRAEKQMEKEKKKSGKNNNDSSLVHVLSPENKKHKKQNKQQLIFNNQVQEHFNRPLLNQNFNSLNNNNFQSRLKTSESNDQEGSLPMQTINGPLQKRRHIASTYLPTYTNRVQNQSFNFLPQRRYMDSYFNELLGERKRFQQEAYGISEINKLFFQQKARAGKIQSRGLEELKKLQNLLSQKSSNYMAGYSNNHNTFQESTLFKKFSVSSNSRHIVD